MPDKAVADAEAKTAEYAERLRLARADAYKLREQRVKQWNAERDTALDAARKAAEAALFSSTLSTIDSITIWQSLRES